MTKFIELVQKANNARALINTDHLISVVEDWGSCLVSMRDLEHPVRVNNSYEQITGMLKEQPGHHHE